jgi:hypothetical protein
MLGSPGKTSSNRLATEPNNTALCHSCADRGRTEEETVLPPEERFDALFRAARVLLRKGIDQEDQIVLTLALAKRNYEDGAYSGEKHREDSWISAFGSLRPVQIVGQVLILERISISIEIRYEVHRDHLEDERPDQILPPHPTTPGFCASL